ncbi:hypothetical protein GHT06_021571 [Daphnia sinensis]|uniref:HAT C-terminal dimerisation domain-containing protein n=1 Tax=Daphnia sinensis TaxID=1820382 RepID=A0AAD5L0G4_9CRUS|nr:hypothetical protein GHT06_021571 [Daphnia sinensis]
MSEMDDDFNRTIQDYDEDIEEGIDENADLNSSRPTSSMSTGSSKSVSGSRGPQKSHPVWAHFKQEMIEGKVWSFCCISNCNYKTKGVIVTNVKNHLTSKHKKEAQELVSEEAKRKESNNSKCKSLKRKTDEEGSIDKFLSAKKSLGKAYSKSSEKYRNLKHKLTIIAACTTISQNAIQSLEFKRYIEECDPNAAACIPSRPTLTSWVIHFRYYHSSLGVAVEKLKYLAGKKLLKVAPTRWNSFFYVCNRLSKLKEAVIKVCLERAWEIDFLWNDVELCRDFLRPMAIATTFLEGHKYSTSPSVVPFLLTISEHLQDSEKKFGRFKNVCENLLGELKSRFSLIMDPYSRNFDSTFLICTMLSPLKTTELDDELFSTGKQRLKMHLLSPSTSITSIRETLSSSTSTVTSTEGKTSVSDGLHTSNKKEEQKIAAQQALCKKRRIVMTDSSSKSQQQLLKEEIEKELEEYFSYLDKNLNATDLTLSQEDPSHFWIQNSLRFPYLSKTAFDFLAIPATSASTERLFSGAGLSTDGNRGNIGPKLLESEACAKYNYRELFKDL